MHNDIMYNLIWYDTLNKPFLTPSGGVFSPVWIFLYTTLLLALILYVRVFSIKNKFYGYMYFIAQMLLNILWSPTFFVYKKIGVALIILILMDIFVVLTIYEFYKFSKISAYLLFPYMVWILFATYLNIGFFVLN